MDGPRPTAWGGLELHVTDPEGHGVTFFAVPEQPAGTIDEAMEAARDELQREGP